MPNCFSSSNNGICFVVFLKWEITNCTTGRGLVDLSEAEVASSSLTCVVAARGSKLQVAGSYFNVDIFVYVRLPSNPLTHKNTNIVFVLVNEICVFP